MAEVGSPSSGSVQTRYSFYNASDTDSTLFDQNSSSLSKENSAQQLLQQDYSRSQSQDDSHSHDHASASASASTSVMTNSNSTIATSATATISAPGNGTNCSGSGSGSGSDNIMDGNETEDILRNLQETEDLGLHNIVKTCMESGNTNTGHATHTNSNTNTNTNTLPDELTNQFEHDFNPFKDDTTTTHDDMPQQNTDNNQINNQSSSSSSFAVSSTSFYEKAVREALYHIRLRAQQRAVLWKDGTSLANKQQQQQLQLQQLQLEQQLEQQLEHQQLEQQQHQSSNQNQNDSFASLPIEEWKARRALMASRIASELSLPPKTNTHTSIPELGSTSASGSGSIAATTSTTTPLQVPLPLHPSSGNATLALATATEFDNRLLSPPADVRKAVEMSSAEMFRIYGNEELTSSSSSNHNNGNNTGQQQVYQQQQQQQQMMNATTGTTTTTGTAAGLQLANPVHSLLAASRESPMQLHSKLGGEVGSGGTATGSHPPFSVVPSSPAPGKFNLLNTKNKLLSAVSNSNSNTTTTSIPYNSIINATSSTGTGTTAENLTHNQLFNGSTNNNNNINNGVTATTTAVVPTAENTMLQRQIELELERRWRREEEIERGVEQVLMSIIQSAATVSSEDDLNSKDVGKGLIDTVFSSLLSNTQMQSHTNTHTHAHARTHTQMQSQLTAVDSTGTLPSTPSKSCSVVDELLAEVEESTQKTMNKLSIRGRGGGCGGMNEQLLPQAPSEHTRVLETEEEFDEDDDDDDNEDSDDSNGEGMDYCEVSKIVNSSSSKKNNASIRPYTVEADGTLEVEAVDRGSRQSSSSMGTTEDDSGDMAQTLGRLSTKVGGTTGVVLDDSDDIEEEIINIETKDNNTSDSRVSSRNATNKNNSSNNGKGKPSMKIIESITAAVRNGPKASEIISKFGGEKKQMRRSTSDDVILPRKKSMPQIKQLYAHMLPYQSNKSNRRSSTFNAWFTDKLSGVFNTAPPEHPWDDEDPDELGYIVHSYSRLQLQAVEQDYEEIMEKINKKFDAAVKKGTVRLPPKKRDSSTEKDKFRSKNSPAQPRRKSSIGKNGRTASSDNLARKSDDGRSSTNKRKLINNKLATNSNFPNAKPAGSGEVGELEIYHLPIIYKAHQTGFEPTKDLVLQPDTVFAGNYYCQSELGSAAFSTAYRCVDLNSGKKGEDGETYYDEVCLKVIKNTKDFFDQSLDEIKILELLRQTNQCHENHILEMKTFFYHKEHLIIVTELLRQNLFEFGKYITDNNEPQYFTRNRLCYICRQCLVALSFVHKLGLVHSDIKPENILLASYSRARVKVIDFGSSCYLTDRQSSYIQSRSYRAPEVILGLPYSGKIDVWSLGCVIAEMYTGQVTFQNDSVVSMLSRIEAICGAFPRQMIENGRQSGQFFTPTGLLYEKSDFDDESDSKLNQTSSTFDEESSNGDSELFNVYQPKITTMAARLGFESNLLEKKRTNWEEEESALFVDFVAKLLTVDPDKRPSADEALGHPWILSGHNLSEEDLKYPPEE